MKVVGFTGNFDNVQDKPECYLMADSSILYTGRPFFVPDFGERFVAAPSIVVRMGRLGKCVAPKFAHRYWDAFTAGFNVQACHDSDPSLGALGRAFDGAAIVGDWRPVTGDDDPLHAVVEFRVDGEVLSRHCLADMDVMPLADMVSAVSTRCSIKMGDLLFTGDCGPRLTLTPGMHLTASVGEVPLLDVKVRL